MARACDILIFGSGSFAQRIAADLASTAPDPVAVALAGRNAQRLAWIGTAARARAHMFGRFLALTTHAVDLTHEDAAGELLDTLKPAVIVQAASLQTGSVIAQAGNAWGRLVAEGGLSATAVFQALLTSRVARAARQVAPDSAVINCCFPDVTNGLIAAMGLPIACGIGNIAILAHAFAGDLDGAGHKPGPTPRLQLLCHYQNIGAWRRLARDRSGPAPRVWLDGEEVGDVFARFAAVQLTPEPVIDISGASGVTLMLALAAGRDWTGHVPGPAGLPGGYPVRLRGGRLELDLPAGVGRDAAIAWNSRYEAENGLIVGSDGRACYRGRLQTALRAESPALAAGFHVDDLEAVCRELQDLRSRLLARP